MDNPLRLLLAVVGLTLLLPGGCSLLVTLPVIGFGFQAMRGESLAAGFFLLGSIAVPVGLICGAWGWWLLGRARAGWFDHPPGWLTLCTALLLLLPWPGLVLYNSAGPYSDLGIRDRSFARALGVVSPVLSICGALLLAWLTRQRLRAR